ncbi:response regulator transcription factor [Alicyclobacillus cycloheptanicus]|uniref:Two-component system response regulator DegU n=1 Tax=Alicyclobacillus cycloheptanicus TaxID=1457 RepID=A0ABT9XMZ1_9BACL|nr:response regulator transcription factor [Alicyclobacillus cycloheptanicus]MDQ0191103.1 two-component system response regulator DegU [Alicyclobacillus cycloheptanicus]WDM02758.1 response regulator transcription factor [Alicyclobacillus cycloheptanicus]
MAQDTIRVAIADDNVHFRETLRDVLEYEKDFEVVGEWDHGGEALEGLATAKPDVLLMDINMPMMGGVEATKRLQQQFPDVKIVILSIHDEAGYVLDTLKSGASGYLVKDGSVSELVRAIREVAAGYAYVHSHVAHTVLAQFQEYQEVNNSWKDILTAREMDVLREMASGKSNEQIAASLHITLKTVKNHVSSIFSKLYVTDRTQAVLVAIKNHWLTV